MPVQTVQSLSDFQALIARFVDRANLQGQNAIEVALALAGVLALYGDRDKAIEVVPQDGEYRNVLWVWIGGVRHALAYTPDQQQIVVREGSLSGKNPILMRIDGKTPVDRLHAFFSKLGARREAEQGPALEGLLHGLYTHDETSTDFEGTTLEAHIDSWHAEKYPALVAELERLRVRPRNRPYTGIVYWSSIPPENDIRWKYVFAVTPVFDLHFNLVAGREALRQYMRRLLAAMPELLESGPLNADACRIDDVDFVRYGVLKGARSM